VTHPEEKSARVVAVADDSLSVLAGERVSHSCGDRFKVVVHHESYRYVWRARMVWVASVNRQAQVTAFNRFMH
jgi:hypothetical protein